MSTRSPRLSSGLRCHSPGFRDGRLPPGCPDTPSPVNESAGGSPSQECGGQAPAVDRRRVTILCCRSGQVCAAGVTGGREVGDRWLPELEPEWSSGDALSQILARRAPRGHRTNRMRAQPRASQRALSHQKGPTRARREDRLNSTKFRPQMGRAWVCVDTPESSWPVLGSELRGQAVAHVRKDVVDLLTDHLEDDDHDDGDENED
jgi:hypothetical protein